MLAIKGMEACIKALREGGVEKVGSADFAGDAVGFWTGCHPFKLRTVDCFTVGIVHPIGSAFPAMFDRRSCTPKARSECPLSPT